MFQGRILPPDSKSGLGWGGAIWAMMVAELDCRSMESGREERPGRELGVGAPANYSGNQKGVERKNSRRPDSLKHISGVHQSSLLYLSFGKVLSSHKIQASLCDLLKPGQATQPTRTNQMPLSTCPKTIQHSIVLQGPTAPAMQTN